MIIKTFFLTLCLLNICVFSQNSDLDFRTKLVEAAVVRTTYDINYDGSYFSIKYPMGDIPSNIGVCTDVIIRTFRALNIDLQKLVHEDMVRHFEKYPSKRIWGLTSTDKNIDHRRVPNLMAFFKRHGKSLALTKDPKDYHPGEIVTWMLNGNLPHIGIVSNLKSKESDRYLIVHNIGNGPKLEDMLFDYPITGHYFFEP